jgi:ParB family chromosome partitioning protein
MAAIEELAASMKEHGLLQPIVVRAVGNAYELIAGHRRLEAARVLGWRTIPAVIRVDTEATSQLLTLVENLQREDLSAREEAAALEILVRERGWSTRQVAAAIHRSPAFVSKRLRVFDDPILAPAVLANELSVSAGEELLKLEPKRRYALLTQAIEGGWDRARIRRAAGSPASTGRRSRGIARRTRQLRDLLRDVSPEDLLEADRRELRQLYLELSLLARAKPGAKRVFPALPGVRGR